MDGVFLIFANSTYTTIIITVIFGPIFTKLIIPSSSVPIEGEDPNALGNTLWGVALGLSYGIVAIIGPVLGAISDVSPRKKSFLFYSYIGCSLSTACLWFIGGEGAIVLAFILIIISNLFFCLGENFIYSFLPYLASKDKLGKISGYAWCIGYLGGMLSVIAVRLIVGESTLENFPQLRLVGPLTGLFFLLGGIPTFLFLKEPKLSLPQRKIFSCFGLAYRNILNTLKSITHYRDLTLFFFAFFFAIASLQIVISFVFIYGDQEIGLDRYQEAIAFVLMNISAALGAFLFGHLQSYWGALKSFMLSLCVWIFAILVIFYIREFQLSIRYIFSIELTLQEVFILASSFSGLCLGSVQSAGRTIIALFSPENKAGEFFGILGFFSKTAALFGLFSIAFLQNLFGLHDSILVIGLFFVLALVICFFVNEKRGRQVI